MNAQKKIALLAMLAQSSFPTIHNVGNVNIFALLQLSKLEGYNYQLLQF